MEEGLCVAVCREGGPIAELLVFALIGGRALYSEWRRRRADAEAADLREKNRQLSLRPAAGVPSTPGLTLNIPAISWAPGVAAPIITPAAEAPAEPANDTADANERP